VIINSTNIGSRLSGIGRSSLSLSLNLLENWDHPFRLYINSSALVHFKDAKHTERIHVSGGPISPDFGFKGHLKRLIWTNKLSLMNHKDLVFNTSQMEGSIHHKRQIITVYDLIPLLQQSSHRRQYYYFKYVLPRVLKNSLRVITSSRHTKELIMERFNVPDEKIRVIHCGVSPVFSANAPVHEKEDYIFYAGRFSPTKNIEGIVRAFEMLSADGKIDLRLKLTGTEKELGFDIGEISKRTREKIDFLGCVSEERLSELYRKASLFVFPSFYEGFGLPPLEAMASGCPVLTSAVSSLPEVCGDAAYYVDPKNVVDIADGMKRVLTDEPLRKEMMTKGLERSRLFSWERSSREHIKVFEEVFESHKGGNS